MSFPTRWIVSALFIFLNTSIQLNNLISITRFDRSFNDKMWIRYGRIHTKYIILALILVASFFVFYSLSIQITNRIIEKSRYVWTETSIFHIVILLHIFTFILYNAQGRCQNQTFKRKTTKCKCDRCTIYWDWESFGPIVTR